MPGITGVIKHRSADNEEQKLNVMLQSMMHESFYTSGSYKNTELGIYIGHISIEDSFSDCMPIHNEKRDLVMFLAGECFVDDDLINFLRRRGHEFCPNNASYLIHLYEEMGWSFFRNLNGWFSGFILDIEQSKAVLFNDRYGMQKIYYHEDKTAFYFSSEAKSLLKVLPSLREMNFQSMGEYFCLDCAINNKTFFSNILLLPPASAWTFSNGTLERKRYFEPSTLENQSHLTKKHFFEELGETFSRILPRYFSGNSVGMALTGGLDTRLILACLNKDRGELPCFTFGGIKRDSIDVRIARKVAKLLDQEHHTIRLDENFLSDYPHHVEKAIYLTDGLADACTADEVYLNKIVRQIAPIKMTGKFGSQVMRGLSLLRAQETNDQLIAPDFMEFISAAKQRYSELRSGHNLTFLLYNEIPWYFSKYTSAEFTQLTVRSPYLDNDFVSLLYKAPLGVLDTSAFQAYLIAQKSPELYRIMTNRGLCGRSSPLISVPLRLLYNFLNRVDTLLVQAILPYSLHHWVARVDFWQVSRLAIGFDKFRFYRLWFRKELSQYLQEILFDRRTLERPYWNKKFLTKIVYDHINGRGNYLSEIRKILTAELIHRVLLDDM